MQVMEVTLIMVEDENKTDMACPKCGSKMVVKKIWYKLKNRSILQCEVCRYYMMFRKE